jgi:hypothetical protein
MKYLCLAYGNGDDWNLLSPSDQEALLAQDELIRQRGDFVAQVGKSTIVRYVGDRVTTVKGSFTAPRAPLVGFYLIEAGSLEEVVDLVSRTPCPRAKGVVEVWPVA